MAVREGCHLSTVKDKPPDKPDPTLHGPYLIAYHTAQALHESTHSEQIPKTQYIKPYNNSPTITSSENPTISPHYLQKTTPPSIPNDNTFTIHNYPMDAPTVHLITHHQGIYPPPAIRVHVDGGANRSVTNDTGILTNVRNIKKYMGFFPLFLDAGEVLYVKCYCCPEVAETIISPTDIVNNHINDLKAWGQHCDLDTIRDGSNYIPESNRYPPLYTPCTTQITSGTMRVQPIGRITFPHNHNPGSGVLLLRRSMNYTINGWATLGNVYCQLPTYTSTRYHNSEVYLSTNVHRVPTRNSADNTMNLVYLQPILKPTTPHSPITPYR